MDFVSLVADTLPINGPNYEFGALQVPGQEEPLDLRQFFPEMEYVGADMREGPGVDIILNLHNINLPNKLQNIYEKQTCPNTHPKF